MRAEGAGRQALGQEGGPEGLMGGAFITEIPSELPLKARHLLRPDLTWKSRDSRARTRSPSPRAWRPDFPGAAREAP